MLATKFASSSKAHTTHALRARISQWPERRSEDGREANGRNCAPGSDLIVVLLLWRIDQSLRQQEDCTSSGTVVCSPLPDHTMLPSQNCYETHRELPGFWVSMQTACWQKDKHAPGESTILHSLKNM